MQPLLVTLVALAGVQEPTHIGAPAGTLTRRPNPTDAACADDGAVWVLNGAAGDVTRHLLTADGTPGAEHDGRWALSGPRPDAPPPARPSGLATLPDGGFVWCDAERHWVVVARPGQAPRALAQAGTGPRQVFAPEGLAARDGRVAVADTGNRRVLVLPLEGDGPTVIATERLVRPMDVGFLSGGRLAVVDAATSRVELFGPDGQWLAGFGDWGYFPGTFAAPTGLDIQADVIYVADTDNHRVQAFGPGAPPEGGAQAQRPYELLYAWGVHALRPGDGDGSLHYPSDVAILRDGSAAAVCEPMDGRVQVFRRAPGKEPPIDPLRVGIGQPAAHYGRTADIDGQFMVIAEPESRNVLLYDLRLDEPVVICTLGGHGERLGMLMWPTGLALDAERRELLVADGALRRLARVRLAIDPAETLRFNAARETWVEALDFGRLGPDVLAPGARPIEPREVDLLPDGGAVLVDGANGRVLRLGPDLVPTRVLLDASDGLVAASDVTTAPDGAHAWIADAGGGALFRVALGASGAPLRLPLTGESRPTNVTVTPDGRVLVSDGATQSLRVFVSDAEGVREVASLGAAPPMAADAPRGTAWLDRRGLGPLWFSAPADLGVDGRGRMIVIDHGNHRGVILDAEGRLLLGFGSRLYTEPLKPRR